MSLKVGIIGVGTAGGWYAEIVRNLPNAELAAALRSPGGDTAAVQDAWGVPCFDTLSDFLDAGLDAVIVATPSGQHFEQAKAALGAGLHVLIEKPICLEVAEAQELVSLAAEKNLRLGVTFQRRADPLFIAVKEAVASGALGKPTLLTITMPYYRTAEYYASAAWRGTFSEDGGGVLMNQGIHLVDLAVWLFGAVRRVSAFATTRLHDVEVEDTLSATLEFSSGALGTVAGTTASPPGVTHSIEVCSTAGSLRLEGERVVRWDVPGRVRPEGGKGDGAAADPRATSTENHARIVADFIEAVQTGRSPRVTGEDAMLSLSVVKAAYTSVREGRTVEL